MKKWLKITLGVSIPLAVVGTGVGVTYAVLKNKGVLPHDIPSIWQSGRTADIIINDPIGKPDILSTTITFTGKNLDHDFKPDDFEFNQTGLPPNFKQEWIDNGWVSFDFQISNDKKSAMFTATIVDKDSIIADMPSWSYVRGMIDFKLNYLPYMDASIYPGFSVDIYSKSNGVL